MTGNLVHWRTKFAEHWDIKGDWTALPGERDLNFRDDRHVYKVMHAGCDRNLVDMQIQCLNHLLQTTLPLAMAIPDKIGNTLNALSINDGESTHWCWVIERLPGVVLADTRPWSTTMAGEIGKTMAHMHLAISDFEHASLTRTLKWDLRQTLKEHKALRHFDTHPLKQEINAVLAQHTKPALDTLAQLPVQAIHNDVNDYNVLFTPVHCGTPKLTGIIDFGDMISAPRVCDLAIAAAYLMLGVDRPIDHLHALVAGYCHVSTLTDEELSLVWPLALTRMAASAAQAHESISLGNDDPYLQISQDGITRFFERHADQLSERIVAGLFRVAGRTQPNEGTRKWMLEQGSDCYPLFDQTLIDAPVLDLAVDGVDASDNPVKPAMAEIANAVSRLSGTNGLPVLGKYREARLIYGAPFFLAGEHQASDRRTMHIAVDVFLPASTAVHAPLDAVVHSAEVCDAAFDYGGLIVLRHEPAPEVTFFTLYGHLAHASARALTPGQQIAKGDVFAHLGEPHENGEWPPHVHFQVGLTDAPGSAWPGVVDPDELDDWMTVFPDPAPLLGMPAGRLSGIEVEKTTTAAIREKHSPRSLRLSYATPLEATRGWQNLLFDAQGRTYLDAYNNVPHVGHSHPRIRAVVDQQLRLLNTNTRYLQPLHEAYTEALCDRMPDALSVCFLLSSGSEANELALRLARTHTGSNETIALRAGYHGHTVTTIEISDYKFAGPGGEGPPDWVHIVENPDQFRGAFSGDEAGAQFADELATVIGKLAKQGKQPGCFIAETFPSVGGQIIPPCGYLKAAYQHVRAAGGVCIADEVQTGLGRLGKYFWGFEQQDVVPDIVVLGKPSGNGYPLAAVITTPEIAASFDTGMEFFATFGGATVACAVGLEVLNIIDDEKLAANAESVGRYLLAGLKALAKNYPLFADVRGMGLFIGVELADADKRPLAEETNYIVNRLREHRILVGSDGPDHNVLKIRPPLTFSNEDADHLLATLALVLQESALAHRR
ncbi:MAG: aminotransferase class III-fold pyridoxal phosphate-dependent enzyme [Woeseiaceae bacterium]